MLPQRQGAIIKRILPSAAACLSLILFQRRAMTNTRWVGSIAWRVPWRQGRSSASCTGGQRTPRRARPVATICAATTAERSWRPRSRPRTSDTSQGPRPRLAGTPRPRTRRQSRRRRTAPRRRSGTRGGSATIAAASRRRRRACGHVLVLTSCYPRAYCRTTFAVTGTGRGVTTSPRKNTKARPEKTGGGHTARAARAGRARCY